MARKTKLQIRKEKLADQASKIQKFVSVLVARQQAHYAAKGLIMSQAEADAFALGYLISMAAEGALASKKFRDAIEDRHTFVEQSAKQMGIDI